MGSTADIKESIVKMYLMGCDYGHMKDRILRTDGYIYKVIEEFKKDGTITVNSRLNRMS